MAYQFLWFDGFDEAQGTGDKYIIDGETQAMGTATFTSVISAPAYNYGRFLNLSRGVFDPSTIAKVLPGSPFQTLFVGFHFIRAMGIDSSEHKMLEFRDEQNNLIQMEVRRIYDSISSTYIFRVYRGSTLVASSSTGFVPHVWQWISFKYHCDPTSGILEINLNGSNVLTFTGNTRNGSVSQVHRALFSTGEDAVGSLHMAIDNLVIATGSPSDPPLPECRVFGACVPTANSGIAFTPSAGTNWDNVDEIPPNDDTNYNYSNTVGAQDVFDASMPTVINGVVYAVKANFRARKEDAGVRTMAPVIRPGSTDHVGPAQSIFPNYRTYGSFWQTNPDTGNPWTPSEVQATKIGYRLVS